MATLSINPASPIPGQLVTVSANSLLANATYQLLWDGSAAGMPTAKTNSTGYFQTQVFAPSPAGNHTLGLKRNATVVVSQTVPVGTTPTVSVTPSSIVQGATTQVSATSLTPNTSYPIKLDNATVLGNATSDASGVLNATVTIPAGTSTGAHTINVGTASASITVQAAQQPPNTIPIPTGAWRASWFNNTTLTGTPTKQTQETAIAFNWGPTGPVAGGAVGPDNFSVRFEGYWDFDGTQQTFTEEGDDGIRSYMDGALIAGLNQWFLQIDTTYTANLTPTSGRHLVTVEHYHTTGGSVCKFSWQPASVIVVPPTGNADWYVSKLGSNADGKSWAGAWNELDQIRWSLVKPGQIIEVDGGALSMTYQSVPNPTVSGTPTAPITIRLSAQSGRNGHAIFSGGRPTGLLPYGSAPVSGGGAVAYSDAPISEILRCKTGYIILDGTKWNYNSGGPTCGITITGARVRGIAMENSSTHWTFKYVEVGDCGWAFDRSGQWSLDGYGVSPAGDSHVFDHCFVHDCGQDAFQTEGGGGYIFTNLTLKHCLIANLRRDVADAPWNTRPAPNQHNDGFQIAEGLHNGLTAIDCIFMGDFSTSCMILGNDGPDGRVDNLYLQGCLFVGGNSTVGDGGALSDFLAGSWTYDHCTFDAANNPRLVCQDILGVTFGTDTRRKLNIKNCIVTGNNTGAYTNARDAGQSVGNISWQNTNGLPIPASTNVDPQYLGGTAKAYGYAGVDADYRVNASGPAAGKGATYGRIQDLMA